MAIGGTGSLVFIEKVTAGGNIGMHSEVHRAIFLGSLSQILQDQHNFISQMMIDTNPTVKAIQDHLKAWGIFFLIVKSNTYCQLKRYMILVTKDKHKLERWKILKQEVTEDSCNKVTLLLIIYQKSHCVNIFV